jgi:hypothetical protein
LAGKRLLVLGPSFRRNRSDGVLPAIERFDGLFFRVARKYLDKAKDVDVLVMKDDLTLIDGKTPLPYTPPKGEKWGRQSFSKEFVAKARERNIVVLNKKLKNGKYSEVFISMGKKYAEALPDFSQYNLRVIFPTYGGPGPKAQALRGWLSGEKF